MFNLKGITYEEWSKCPRPTVDRWIAAYNELRKPKRMKLKEKWFKQFYASKKGTPLYGISWEDAARMIYFAGFEKAREMSAEAMKPFSYETGYRFGLFSTNETKTVISSFSLDKIIMNIGEEEVEDELT